MLFSIQEIDLLRALRWCSYILPTDLSPPFTQISIENLRALKLVSTNQKSGAMVLTPRGQSFLDGQFQDLPPRTERTYRDEYILRRTHTAKTFLTAYRAGLSTFLTSPSALEKPSSYYLIAQSRIRGFNPWGSTRIAALVRLSDMLYGLHFVFPGVGGIALADELNLFNNNTAHIRNIRRSLIFAGQTYADALEVLASGQGQSTQRLVSYAEAYRRVRLPVHLLSCDGTGALQLRIMAQPEYRKRLTMAALKTQYQPPPGDHPEWDAIFQGAPFVMAADMELRRIDAAIQSARSAKLRQVSIVALKDQVQAVLSKRYRDTGLARVFTLSPDALSALGDMALFTPSRRQFETTEGDVIDAPLIQADRKSGRQSRK